MVKCIKNVFMVEQLNDFDFPILLLYFFLSSTAGTGNACRKEVTLGFFFSPFQTEEKK